MLVRIPSLAGRVAPLKLSSEFATATADSHLV